MMRRTTIVVIMLSESCTRICFDGDADGDGDDEDDDDDSGR